MGEKGVVIDGNRGHVVRDGVEIEYGGKRGGFRDGDGERVYKME